MTGTARLWHRFFLRGALILQIFPWIFIFNYFYTFFGTVTIESAVVSVALTYALTQVITILLTPFSAIGLRHGYRNRMILAACAVALAYFSLSAFPAQIGVAAFVILMGVYRAFYWAPYRIAARSDTAQTSAWTAFVLALFPLLAGFVLDAGSNAAYLYLYSYGAALLALLSVIPLFSMRDTQEGYAWGYRQTFHQLFDASHRRLTLTGIMHGIEMSLLLTLWPLIVFVIVGESFALLGIVLSIIYILSIAVQSIAKRPIMNLSAPTRALAAASAWIMRLSVVGSIGVILVDVFFYGGSNASSRGLDTLTLEHTADNTTYVDEFTVLKEISMALGRLIMSLVIVFLAYSTSIQFAIAIAFIVGAFAAAISILSEGKRARV